MLCAKCGTENLEGAEFCKECGTRMEQVSAPSDAEAPPAAGDGGGAPAEEPATGAAAGEQPDEAAGVEVAAGAGAAAAPTTFARVLSTAWSRRGPILMALCTVLMMSMVFAPWAFLKFDVLGFQIVSNSYTGWAMYIPRILFFLSVIPLLLSVMMIAGIGTRRRVVETHICTFAGGVIFAVWIIIFSLSQVISSLIKNVRVVHINVAGAQVATILFFVGFMVGVVLTSYDRGRELEDASMGG